MSILTRRDGIWKSTERLGRHSKRPLVVLPCHFADKGLLIRLFVCSLLVLFCSRLDLLSVVPGPGHGIDNGDGGVRPRVRAYVRRACEAQ